MAKRNGKTTQQATGWQNRIVGEGTEAPDQLLANPANWRIHPKPQQDALTAVLDNVGWVQRVIVNKRTGHIVDGHLRVSMAISRNEPGVPVLYVDLSEDEERTILATIDPLSAMAATDAEQLADLLAAVETEDAAVRALLEQIGQERGIELGTPQAQSETPTLSDVFVVPPFSVLDARQGYWQERKRAWLALGIQSELGRGEGGDAWLGAPARINGKLPADSGGQPLPLDRKVNGKGLARAYAQDLMRGESRRDADQRSNLNDAPPLPPWATATGTQNMASGTSIFDPVLCELVYRWFSPPDAAILDPFAGGSVRGIVASKLGRQYTGIELRAEQVAANEAQAQAITPDAPPMWIVGDSQNAATLAPGYYDLLFSCPPYYDLEIYSDDPADLSNKSWDEFCGLYTGIIRAACAMLRDDRFACFVVGDVRDKQGNYRDFPGLTIDAFTSAGLSLYNEAILVTAVGSLPIRVGKQMQAGRKLGKTHQNVLVFVKGDGKRASQACGPIAFTDTLWPDTVNDTGG